MDALQAEGHGEVAHPATFAVTARSKALEQLERLGIQWPVGVSPAAIPIVCTRPVIDRYARCPVAESLPSMKGANGVSPAVQGAQTRVPGPLIPFAARELWRPVEVITSGSPVTGVIAPNAKPAGISSTSATAFGFAPTSRSTRS